MEFGTDFGAFLVKGLRRPSCLPVLQTEECLLVHEDFYLEAVASLPAGWTQGLTLSAPSRVLAPENVYRNGSSGRFDSYDEGTASVD